MAKVSAINPDERRQPAPATMSYRRRLMPWSSCRVPESFQRDLSQQREIWAELATCLVAELVLLRNRDADLAFERLMVVHEAVGPAFCSRHKYDVPPEGGSPVLNAAPDFLRAVAADASGDVAGRLYAALNRTFLEPSVVPRDMFDNLAHADRSNLVERLAALDPVSLRSQFLRPVLTHVLLSEPDVNRLIGMAEASSLWDRVDAVAMLDRLMAGRHYVPKFPLLVVRAILEDAAEQDRTELLDRTLAYCEIRGKHDIAQEIRLRLFNATFAVPFAREWLRHMTSREEARAKEAHLIKSARSHSRRGQALLFLLEWPSLADAISLARTCHEEMDDIEAWQLKEASAQLEDVAPDAALKLYRKSDNIRDALGRVSEQIVQVRRAPWYTSWPAA